MKINEKTANPYTYYELMNNITNNTMYTVQERHILLLSFRVELETILFE